MNMLEADSTQKLDARADNTLQFYTIYVQKHKYARATYAFICIYELLTGG